MDILRLLPNNEYQAAVNANAPTAINPFATIADINAAGVGGIYNGSGDLVAGTTVVTMNSGDFLRFSSLTGPFDLFTLDAANNRVGIGTPTPGHQLHIIGGDIYVQSGYMAIGGTTPAQGQLLKINPQDTDHAGGTAPLQAIRIDFAAQTSNTTYSGVDVRHQQNIVFNATANPTQTFLFDANYKNCIVSGSGTRVFYGIRVQAIATNAGAGTLTNVGGYFEVANGDNNYAIQIVDGSQGVDKVLRSDANGVGTWVDPNTLVTTPTLATVLAAGGTSGANNITMSAGQEILFTSGAFFGYLGSAALTSDRTYDLPDRAGTLAVNTGQTWTNATNVVTTRGGYDADATTLDAIADNLGTLISDLKSVGILS